MRSFTIFLLSCLLFSCGNGTGVSQPPAPKSDAAVTPPPPDQNPSPPPVPPTRPEGPVNGPVKEVTVKAFEVKDASDKSSGWGYDLFVNGKAAIHQPHFPGVPGTKAFKTEAQALKCGNLAAHKLKSSGNFPTIEVKELDSLGIDYK
jgi:hypothetical protein